MRLSIYQKKMKSQREIAEDIIIKFIDNGVLTEEDFSEIYEDSYLVPLFHIHTRNVIEKRLYRIEQDKLWEKNGYNQLSSRIPYFEEEIKKYKNGPNTPGFDAYSDIIFATAKINEYEYIISGTIKEMKQFAGKRCIKHVAQEANRRTTEKILIEAFNQKDLGLLMMTFIEECNEYKIIGKKKFKYY